MKKVVIPMIAAALFATACGDKQENNALKVGVDAPYPPFEFKAPDGTLTGFEIELGNAVCQEITQQDCDWVIQAWDGIIPGLLARKYDMIFSSMSINAERQEKVLFSDPYYTTPSAFFAEQAFDVNDATGLRIGVQRATIQDTYVTELVHGAEPVRYTTADDMVVDIKAGRLDAMFVDAPVGLEMLGGDSNIIQVGDFVKEPISIFGEGVGAAFRKDDTELEDKVSAALAKIKASGQYDTLMKKYFDFDIKL